MKYIVVLGDGMSDYPVLELGNKTPLEYAKKPILDSLAKNSIMGMVKTVPEHMPPGSDTANLSVMGYDPQKYYSGRSPFEAASMGVEMKDSDITFRCNLVTVSEDNVYENKKLLDHSSDEISSDEAKELINCVNKYLSTQYIKFFPGISYRHLMLWDEGPYEWNLTPPHDILGKSIAEFLPKGTKSEIIFDMMKKSYDFLSKHEININRVNKGLNPANSIWIWGEGKKPMLSSFSEKYGISGSVVSAVDLIKGIGICAGLDSIDVEGATGNINTNFRGKAEAALNELRNGKDFVYIHIEAPDECGHRQEISNKCKSIELIDREIIKVLLDELNSKKEKYRILVLPDHPTPLVLRTHTNEPVPFLMYQSDMEINSGFEAYNEMNANSTSLFIEDGHKLMDYFLNGELFEILYVKNMK